jgi:hypothetical protein
MIVALAVLAFSVMFRGRSMHLGFILMMLGCFVVWASFRILLLSMLIASS